MSLAANVAWARSCGIQVTPASAAASAAFWTRCALQIPPGHVDGERGETEEDSGEEHRDDDRRDSGFVLLLFATHGCGNGEVDLHDSTGSGSNFMTARSSRRLWTIR